MCDRPQLQLFGDFYLFVYIESSDASDVFLNKDFLLMYHLNQWKFLNIYLEYISRKETDTIDSKNANYDI